MKFKTQSLTQTSVQNPAKSCKNAPGKFMLPLKPFIHISRGLNGLNLNFLPSYAYRVRPPAILAQLAEALSHRVLWSWSFGDEKRWGS